MIYGQLTPFSITDFKKIHQATLQVLEKTGAMVSSLPALEKLKAAGHKVDFDKKVVRFDPAVVEGNIKNCPGSLDRRPANKMLRFSCDGGTGFVFDLASRANRKTTIKDLEDFCRLADALENIDEISFPLFPSELPYEIMDLTIAVKVWSNTHKTGGGGLSRNGAVWMNTSRKAVEYLLQAARIRFGGKTKPDGSPLISGFVGAASPLRFDKEMMDLLEILLDLKQTAGLGSNVIAGAQAPVNPAATVLMENAERMALLSIALAFDKNASIYFCNHPNFLDLASGNVSNGSPEHSLMAMAGTGLLHYYGFNLLANHPAIPASAHEPGIQCAMEKCQHALLTGLSGAGGVCAMGALNEAMSMEQLVLDNEMAGMVKRYLKGFDISDQSLHLDAIHEIGIGGNFLDHEATLSEMRNVYWKPSLFNRVKYSEWERTGRPDMLAAATREVQRILATHFPSPLSEPTIKELEALLNEARRELIKK